MNTYSYGSQRLGLHVSVLDEFGRILYTLQCFLEQFQEHSGRQSLDADIIMKIHVYLEMKKDGCYRTLCLCHAQRM